MSEAIKDTNKEAAVREMFEVGAHFGYAKSSRHSSTKPYVFGFKGETAIIDLEKTAALLEGAKDFVRTVGKDKKTVIFVGTKNEAKNAVKQAAESVDAPYVIERWIGGTLTNFKQIRTRIERMHELIEKGEKGELSVYTKKERGVLAKELTDLRRFFEGLSGLSKLPGAIFVVDSKKEAIAVAEAVKLKIPVISLSNSDCDLEGIKYPIVGNDASVSSISYFSKQIAEAYREGLSAAKEEKPVEKTV